MVSQGGGGGKGGRDGRPGYVYSHGEGIRWTVRSAMDWYHKAAVAGNVFARFNIAHLYARAGACTGRHQALAWYVRAANTSDAQRSTRSRSYVPRVGCHSAIRLRRWNMLVAL